MPGLGAGQDVELAPHADHLMPSFDPYLLAAVAVMGVLLGLVGAGLWLVAEGLRRLAARLEHELNHYNRGRFRPPRK